MKFKQRVYAPFDVLENRMYPGFRLAVGAHSFNWIDADIQEDISPLSLYPEKVQNIFQNLIPFAATDSDCERRKMGCLLTDLSLNIVATGSNVKPEGLQGDCRTAGCHPEITCRLTIHAESSAFTKLTHHKDYQELRKNGLIVFCTASTCLDCAKLCQANNVQFVVYLEERPQPIYDQPVISAVTMSSRIKFVKVSDV